MARPGGGISTREKLLGGAAAFAVVVMMLQRATAELLDHPRDAHMHPVRQVERHEEEIVGFHGALKEMVETLKRLDAERAAREAKAEAERAKQEAEQEERRRTFWLEQREKDRQQLLDVFRQQPGGMGRGRAGGE